MDRHRIAIVIPALNEEHSIGRVIHAAIPYGRVIVVDDGSTDNTAEISKSLGAHIVSHPCNLGYDKALNSGFREAESLGYSIIISLDADGQHNPNLIGQFIAEINRGADMAIGVRNHYARIGEAIFARFTKWYYGVSDPLCGMKAYSTDVYRALGYFDSYGSIGTELLISGIKNKFKFAEIPIVVNNRIDKSRFGQKFRANYKIIFALLYTMAKYK